MAATYPLRVLLLSLAASVSAWLVWWCAAPQLAQVAHLIDGSSAPRQWTLADVVAAAVALVAVGAFALLLATAVVAIAAHVFVPQQAARLAARGWAGPTWWRTLVLAACGIGVAAQATTAAAYAPDRPPCAAACAPSLDGLPYPDLPTGPWPQQPGGAQQHRPHEPTARGSGAHEDPGQISHAGHAGHVSHVVVRSGDCLWSIAAGLSPPNAGDTAIAALAARLYADNRPVIGADPDLIYPGTVLRAPGGSR
jgi:hypothetical protein